MGITFVKVQISNPADKVDKKIAKEVTFLVDSGAYHSFVNKNVLKQLHIQSEGTKEFALANGEYIERQYGFARFDYGRTSGGATVIFGEEGDENLLGATTLEALGLMLNPVKREILPLKLRA